ncbi:hypothetical protein C6A86_017955 [Mycobacterium sp. ITM-2016-00316]|uniref:DUF7161 family protein n=1 Tax=Mycobacterium sp. ITM-2016-00316 TaxID=2099695 RepID=UPI000CF8C900|nr:hypothetical protein [Mycobacterium sp. ITM-2016-00316]WNG80133.1 hypothetical protein C6A86_017955 [Mycobacterium sp. ITM-2016-00316]
MHAVDAVATILLFVALLGWVGLSVYAGAMSVTLSDSGAPGVAVVGVLLAVIGIPASVIAVYVAAIVYAWQADGYTFFYPLVALAAGTLLAALVAAVAFGLVRLGLRLHGTDADTDKGSEVVTAPAVYAFDTVHELRDGALVIELGIERSSGRRYLRTPMPQRDGEYREFFGIDIAMYDLFSDDRGAALAFAEQCRAGRHEDRWLPPPGAPAAIPPSPERKHLARKRAILLTDHPVDASGAAAPGLPVGIAFVRIVGNRVDADGNLAVRLPGEGSDVVSVDARLLGVH